MATLTQSLREENRELASQIERLRLVADSVDEVPMDYVRGAVGEISDKLCKPFVIGRGDGVAASPAADYLGEFTGLCADENHRTTCRCDAIELAWND